METAFKNQPEATAFAGSTYDATSSELQRQFSSRCQYDRCLFMCRVGVVAQLAKNNQPMTAFQVVFSIVEKCHT